MSLGDIALEETGGLNAPPTDRWGVAAGTPPTIEPGEPCKQSAAAADTIITFVDADHTVGTDQPIAGISITTSDEVSGTAGFVDVYTPVPNLKYTILALTASLADTRAELDAFVGEAHIIDLTSGAFRLDTAAGNTATNAFICFGGDPDESAVFFRIRSDSTRIGSAQV